MAQRLRCWPNIDHTMCLPLIGIWRGSNEWRSFWSHEYDSANKTMDRGGGGGLYYGQKNGNCVLKKCEVTASWFSRQSGFQYFRWWRWLHASSNHGCCANVGLMLGQRRRRWPNIKPTLCPCPVFSVTSPALCNRSLRTKTIICPLPALAALSIPIRGHPPSLSGLIRIRPPWDVTFTAQGSESNPQIHVARLIVEGHVACTELLALLARPDFSG